MPPIKAKAIREYQKAKEFAKVNISTVSFAAAHACILLNMICSKSRTTSHELYEIDMITKMASRV